MPNDPTRPEVHQNQVGDHRAGRGSRDCAVVSADNELLELAAKAAGLKVIFTTGDGRGLRVFDMEDEWNPLTDDGDALRLAVKLGLDLRISGEACLAGDIYNDSWDSYEEYDIHSGDKMPAARRAIVIAAAQIGRCMP